MGVRERSCLILTVSVLGVCQAGAQTLPWMAPPLSPPQTVQPLCMGEFTKLRAEVQKRGMAAKMASERKATRSEICEHIRAYSAAELEWVEFSEANFAICGLPLQIAQQLRQVHARTLQTQEGVCQQPPPEEKIRGWRD